MNNIITLLAPIIIAVFGSTGFWSYLQNKKDKTSEVLKAITEIKSDITEVKNDMSKLKANIDENEAKNARNRIVRFSDEIRTGQKKSKDYYDHILLDIDAYEKFCNMPEHVGFKNGIAEISIKKIKQHYEADDFI